MNRTFIRSFAISLLLLLSIREQINSGQLPRNPADLPLMINEFMALNFNDRKDEFGENNDWVEVYNGGQKKIEMAGLFFTDDLADPKKWKIPKSNLESTTISPNGHLLFWFDKDPEQGPLHIDFKLAKEKGVIGLFAEDGITLLDSVSYKTQIKNVSFGRVGDGQEKWGFFPKPSSGKPNSDQWIISTSQVPTFSHESGFYTEPITLTISCKGVTRIFYSDNGDDPFDNNKMLYTEPIEIKETMVIRVVVFDPGAIPSKSITKTYFINEQITIPVVSLTSDTRNLWNKKVGIYNEKNEEEIWERPAYFEYFNAKGEQEISMEIGVKLFGRFSRRSKKKSFTLVPRSKYGDDMIHYKFFDDKDIDTFKGIIIRADASYGIDIDESSKYMVGARIKNELIYEINKELGSKVDMQAYQPAILFLNGKYWGLYTIMERKGVDFIRSNFAVKGPLDIINPYDRYRDPSFVIKRGDGNHYKSMMKFIKHNNLNDTAAYERVMKMIDLENFIDCWIYEVYMSKGDCNTNTRMWRPKTMEGKWRCMSFDQDHWKKYRMNMFDRLTDSKRGRNAILRELFKSDRFTYTFINRLADCMNTVLLPGNVKRLIDEIDAKIAVERRRDRERWKEQVKYAKGGEQVSWIKYFAERRPSYLKDDVVEWFELDGRFELFIDVKPMGKGRIVVNTLYLETFPWSGVYYQNIPISISAIPAEGYVFDSWSAANTSSMPLRNAPIISTNKGDVSLIDRLPDTQFFDLNFEGNKYAIQANFRKK